MTAIDWSSVVDGVCSRCRVDVQWHVTSDLLRSGLCGDCQERLDAAEPVGLWAVVSVELDCQSERAFYVKGARAEGWPAYWFAVGGEDGYGWEQVTRHGRDLRVEQGGRVTP